MKLKVKLKTVLTSTITSTLLCSSLFALSTSVQSAVTPKKERWFEIEVILFNQLDDKNKLKEQFPEQAEATELSKLKRYRRVSDLLTPFVYPNISALKAHLPLCSTTMPTLHDALLSPIDLSAQGPHKQRPTLPPLLTLKNLTDIDLSEDPLNEFNNELAEGVDDTLIDDNETALAITPTDDLNDSQLIIKESTNTQQTEAEQDFLQEDALPYQYQLSEQELALLTQAEQEFNSIRFNMHANLPKEKICNLSDNNNHFTVDKLPETIDGIEDLYGSKPYLIAKESLQLTDIVTQLKRSKNFKPLLHIGWREAPKGRNKAIAQRVFAGDNLQAHFKKQQDEYQQSVDEILQRKQAKLNDTIDNVLETQITPEQLYQEKVQLRINDILSQVSQITADDEQAILQQLDSKKLTLGIDNPEAYIDENILPEPPIAPIQDWYLEGFFKVHLNHYLYITADFNILNKTLAEMAILSKEEKAALKSIRFEQNRRVISKEVHYFDHPYIGMIVQIRRFTQPEPLVDCDDLTTNKNAAKKTTNNTIECRE